MQTAMNTVPSSSNISLLRLGGVVILSLVSVVYLVLALSTGDWIWFWPLFDAQPDSIIVHCYGEDVSLQPGSSHFSEVVNLVNEGLSGRKHWSRLSLSEVVYEQYQTSPDVMILELSYTSPVRLHSPTKFFSSIDTLIVPLDGRYAEFSVVFGRRGEVSAPGSFHIETIAPLMEYMESEGLCRKP